MPMVPVLEAESTSEQIVLAFQKHQVVLIKDAARSVRSSCIHGGKPLECIVYEHTQREQFRIHGSMHEYPYPSIHR